MIEPIPPEHASDAYIRLVRERHVDGIILSGPQFDDEDLLDSYASGEPVVLMRQLPHTGLPCVDVDNVGGAALATQILSVLMIAPMALTACAPSAAPTAPTQPPAMPTQPPAAQPETIVAVHNLSNAEQSVAIDLSRWSGRAAHDLLSEADFPMVTHQPYTLKLQPYQACWLQLAA